MQLHDTHLHLDVLLQKLGHLPSDKILEQNLDSVQLPILSDQAYTELNTLLQNHQLAIQSTGSTKNLQIVHQLLNGRIPQLRFLLGSHPEIVNSEFDLNNYLEIQTKFVAKSLPKLNNIVGIGECGLDYFYTQDSTLIQTQKQLFRSQIQLAIDLNLPLVIHCREAFIDLFEILEEYPKIHGRFLVHCFTGNIQELQSIQKFGGKIGIGGIVTFPSAVGLQEAVIQASLSDIMLETDLPFLSPVPHRGKICLPEYVEIIAKKLAELKSISVEEVINSSWQNAQLLFKLN